MVLGSMLMSFFLNQASAVGQWIECNHRGERVRIFG